MPKTRYVVPWMVLLVAGCSEPEPDDRLTQVTTQALAMQAAQNQQMADLELCLLERCRTVDAARDAIEQERQLLAAARLREPLLANALLSAATLLVAALPLAATVLLLVVAVRQPPAADHSLLLVDELLSDRLVPTERLTPPRGAPPALPGA